MIRRDSRGSVAVCACLLLAACSAGRGPITVDDPRTDATGLLRKAQILRAEDRREISPELLDAVRDEAPEIRARAVLALGRIGDPSRLQLVEAGLGDSAPQVRRAAAEASGLLADPASLPRLHEAAGDDAAEVRASVADALGQFRSADSAPALLGLLQDDAPAVATAACLAVARLDEATFAVDALLSLGDAEDRQLLWSATYALSRLAAAPRALDFASRGRARQRMIELSDSPSAELRRLAAIGLDIPSSEEEAVAAGKLVEDPDATVRIAAIDSLSFPGAPVEPFLTKVLEDPDDRVMLALVDGFGQMRGSEIVDRLSKIVVHDERLWLRTLAVEAMGRASRLSAKVANGLSRAVEPEIRREAAALLVGKIDDESEEIARRLYTDSEVGVRAAIIPAFSEIAEPLSASIGAAIEDPEPRIRAAVAAAAGRRRASVSSDDADRREATELLERLWRDGAAEAEVALAVLDALGRGEPTDDARAAIERGLSHGDRAVRLRAVRLLDRLYGADRSQALGPAADRPIEHYLEILRWAQTDRAAVVTVRRPGFVPGRFTIRLDTRTTPLTAWHFARLAESGHYDKQPIYRRHPKLYWETGDSRGDGTGVPASRIRDELRLDRRFWPGTLGMQRTAPDDAGSQWFVTLAPQPRLAATHTAFAQVIQNYPGVAALLLPGDRVVSVRIYEGDGTEPLPPLE